MKRKVGIVIDRLTNSIVEVASGLSFETDIEGVAGNMVAFACKRSFELGFDGYVAFTAKTKLVDHYIETLGAQMIYSQDRMGIFTPAAKKIVSLYYKGFFDGG